MQHWLHLVMCRQSAAKRLWETADFMETKLEGIKIGVTLVLIEQLLITSAAFFNWKRWVERVGVQKQIRWCWENRVNRWNRKNAD